MWFNCLISGTYHSHNGADTPHYYKMRRSGALLPINAYIRVDSSVEILGGFSFHHPDWAGNRPYWATGGGSLPLHQRGFAFKPSDSKMQGWKSQINSSYLAQQALAGLQAEFDALTFLMESRELPGLIWDTAKRADSLSLGLLKQGFRGKPNYKELASDWLRWNFGWKPFMADVESILDICNNKVSSRVRSARRNNISFSESEVVNYSQNEFVGQWHLEHNVSLYARAVAISKVESAIAVVDVPTTVWELIKFSWAIDYVLDVGNALQAYAAYRAHPDLLLSLGTLLEVQTTGNNFVTSQNGFTSDVSTSSNYRATYADRVGVSPSFLPQLRMCLPNLTQALNLLSVAAQRL